MSEQEMKLEISVGKRILGWVTPVVILGAAIDSTAAPAACLSMRLASCSGFSRPPAAIRSPRQMRCWSR